MCANPQSNRLNTIAVRASYIYLFEAISLVKTKKDRGGLVYLPPEKLKQKPVSFFFIFGVDPLNWQSFTEIGGMARSTTAGVLVDTLLSHYLAVLKRSIRT